MPRKAAIGLLAVVLVGGALRWSVMEWTAPVALVGDEKYYVAVARSLARDGVAKYRDTRALRPPAHAFLLSLAIRGAGPAPERSIAAQRQPLLRLQVALGTAVVALTALLGAALFDRRTGLLAGAVAAVYPELVAFSHYLWSENLFTVLLLGGLLLVVEGRRARGFGHAAAAGLVFGIGALTRETALWIGGLAALWWWATSAPPERRRALAKAALLCSLAVACLVPWTLRNQRVLGRPVPVSTIGWFAAGEGNSLEAPDWMQATGPKRASFKRAYLAIPGEIARMDFARRYTLASISAEQPAWIVKKLVRNCTQLFTPDSSLLYKARTGAYGKPLPRGVMSALVAVSAVPYGLVFLVGTLGLAATRGDGRLLLPCLVVGGAILTHVLTNATVRFRLPWMPLFIIYASRAIVARHRILESMSRGRWLALAGGWLFFLGLCVPYFFTTPAALD
jgi:4-amino-4-deoxy-L-arabinose transferase-like glycosyltransferase